MKTDYHQENWPLSISRGCAGSLGPPQVPLSWRVPAPQYQIVGFVLSMYGLLQIRLAEDQNKKQVSGEAGGARLWLLGTRQMAN